MSTESEEAKGKTGLPHIGVVGVGNPPSIWLLLGNNTKHHQPPKKENIDDFTKLLAMQRPLIIKRIEHILKSTCVKGNITIPKFKQIKIKLVK